MKTYRLCFLLLIGLFICSCGGKTKLMAGQWQLRYNDETKGMDISKNSMQIFENVYPSYKLNDRLVTSKDYTDAQLTQTALSDPFGKGTVFNITYTGKDLPTLVQSYYVYPDRDYILTDFTLSANAGVSSNYMAPVNVDKILPVWDKGDNRALFVPFDNDAWIRFQSHPLTFDKLRSYEVSAIFNNTTRQGLVVGSVEHDRWKSAVDMTADGVNISSLKCYGGVADSLTRDHKEHGALTGKTIKSPKILIGSFADWRTGMETYADANATITPPRAWDKAVPFGWNSWGVLQFNLTYEKAMEVSDFFKENLQNNHFVNADKTVYIGLDSGWNSFTEEQLKSFVARCKANGQVAGVYWTPFTDWSKNPEREVDDATQYKYKDIYVYANGKPQELDGAYGVDPTHPAIEQKMKTTSEMFRRCGFEYVKMDFMTHGAMEADKWYRPEIKTGMQAYNYGMQLLDKYFGDIYINLSISPIFPAQYAQSRRIACDAWNKIKDTEYTMNAVSYGWWIDRVYRFNDADHVVLRDATKGENRARVTSAVITGLYISGDDFSKGGSTEGKDRAKLYLTNADVNAAAQGRSFRPLEGNRAKSENQFTLTDKEGNTYYAVFNYGDNEMSVTIPLERIGLDASKQYMVKELWSGWTIDPKTAVIVPAKDVRLFRIR